VIFFIFLYQKYIYKVDPKRVNEFGTSQEMFDENGVAIEAKPDEKGDIGSDNAEQPEDATPAEPKSAQEKKDD